MTRLSGDPAIWLSVDLVILVWLWVLSVMLIVVRHDSLCVVVNCVCCVVFPSCRLFVCCVVYACLLLFSFGPVICCFGDPVLRDSLSR